MLAMLRVLTLSGHLCHTVLSDFFYHVVSSEVLFKLTLLGVELETVIGWCCRAAGCRVALCTSSVEYPIIGHPDIGLP